MPSPSELTDAIWSKHKYFIQKLYIMENMKLADLMLTMRRRHKFVATLEVTFLFLVALPPNCSQEVPVCEEAESLEIPEELQSR